MSEKDNEEHAESIIMFNLNKTRNPLGKRATHYYDECRHLKVVLDDQTRSLTCKACGKQLDAFWYLTLLSQEWQQRAYRDNEAKKAAAELRQEHLNAQARGHFFTRPKEGPASEAWDMFAEYYGAEPFSIYRKGRMWYSEEANGTRLSKDYVLMLLSRGKRFEAQQPTSDEEAR